MGLLEGILRDAIVRQVDKYGPILEKTVQQKIYLYSHKFGRKLRDSIEYCWIKTYDKIRELETKDVLRYFSVRGSRERWLVLPDYIWDDGTIPDDIMEDAKRKMDLVTRWRRAVDGHYAERLVADALVERGFAVTRNPVFDHPNGESLEIDVEAIKDGRVYLIEVKNRYSDCFHSPSSVGGTVPRASEEQRKVWHFFEFAASAGGSPVLIASLADRSLIGWVSKYGGKYMNLLYQILPDGTQDLAEEVKAAFALGHVQSFKEPPKNIGPWVDAHLL